MRASSRGTRDHDSVISGGAAPLPFVRRNESRPISRRRASAVGRPKSIAALIDTSGWRRTGARVPDWGWQRLFDESDTVATWPSAGQFNGNQRRSMAGPYSDLEPRFVCQACGQRGADVRPDFDWDEEPKAHRAQ